MTELENALAQQTPPMPTEDPSRHELPPLVIDGIPTPVEKMTQAQLRAFIPLMLKFSTGRGKPGVNFTNVLRAAFTHTDPKIAINTVKSFVSFCDFGIYAHKSF
jgi:hypothetical protein